MLDTKNQFNYFDVRFVEAFKLNCGIFYGGKKWLEDISRLSKLINIY